LGETNLCHWTEAQSIGYGGAWPETGVWLRKDEEGMRKLSSEMQCGKICNDGGRLSGGRGELRPQKMLEISKTRNWQFLTCLS
jgi:hypothetical protein